MLSKLRCHVAGLLTTFLQPTLRTLLSKILHLNVFPTVEAANSALTSSKNISFLLLPTANQHLPAMPPALQGALRVRVIRGIDLAIRDIYSSDPYVVITMGSQKVKTRVIKRTTNPEWNDELTLSISDPKLPIKLTVYDHDRFSKDDAMGEAMIDIGPYMEALELGLELEDLPVGTAVKKVQPSTENCLTDESKVIWVRKGKMVQEMGLRLKKVEKGVIAVEIEWIDFSNSAVSAGSKRGFSFRS